MEACMSILWRTWRSDGLPMACHLVPCPSQPVLLHQPAFPKLYGETLRPDDLSVPRISSLSCFLRITFRRIFRHTFIHTSHSFIAVFVCPYVSHLYHYHLPSLTLRLYITVKTSWSVRPYVEYARLPKYTKYSYSYNKHTTSSKQPRRIICYKSYMLIVPFGNYSLPMIPRAGPSRAPSISASSAEWVVSSTGSL